MYTTISLGRLVSAASPSWLKIVENFRWSGHANGCCKPKWRNDWKSFGACCRPALGDVRREQIRCLWRCLNPYKVGPQKNGLKKMVAIALITCNRPWIVGYRNTPKKMVSLWEPFCIVLLDPTLVGKTFGKTCSLENHGTIGWHIFEGFKGVTFDHLWSVFGPRAPS